MKSKSKKKFYVMISYDPATEIGHYHRVSGFGELIRTQLIAGLNGWITISAPVGFSRISCEYMNSLGNAAKIRMKRLHEIRKARMFMR